ncbi:MAG TPA: hypothetical protein VEL07_12720 [Planctomycetota bacterium]|nr:hypothetical protein [Planctomycetota bacterium]
MLRRIVPFISACALASLATHARAEGIWEPLIFVSDGAEWIRFMRPIAPGSDKFYLTTPIRLGPAPVPPPVATTPAAGGGIGAAGIGLVVAEGGYAIYLAYQFQYWMKQAAPTTAIPGSIGEPAHNPSAYETDYWAWFWKYYSWSG